MRLKTIFMIILGITVILYGAMIRGVGSGTIFWIVWEIIGVFCLILAYLFHKRFFSLHRKVGIAFHIMLAIGFIVLGVLCSMITSKFSSKGQDNLDYVIVLGAQVRENGPSVVLKYRLDTAIMYLEENPDTVCIVSGGQGKNEPFSEAHGMADYMIKNGITFDRILLEDQSTNTVENISYSKEWLENDYRNVGIVTNNFHVFRAVRIAKQQGLKNVSGISAPSNKWYLPNNVLRECLGILKDWIYGNI